MMKERRKKMIKTIIIELRSCDVDFGPTMIALYNTIE